MRNEIQHLTCPIKTFEVYNRLFLLIKYIVRLCVYLLLYLKTQMHSVEHSKDPYSLLTAYM